jgi:hypothetical protein
MIRARLTVIYSDDIRTVYGQIISKAPLVLQINSYSTSMTDDALEMMLQWHEAGAAKCVQAEFVKAEGNNLHLKVLKDLRGKSECVHKVEYKGSFEVKKITADEYNSYARKAERINSSTKNNTVNKLITAIPNETVSNQHLFRFLVELDSKLEKLIYLAESERNPNGLETKKALYLSSEGCGFFTDNDVKMGDLFFIEARTFDTGGRLRFAVTGKVIGGRRTKLGVLVDFEFGEMEEAVRENIIRYVFEKDRELLKEAREQ